MVSRITLQVLMGLTAAALVATPAAAQRRARARAAAALERPSYGPHLGYNFDAKDLLLGAQLTYPITPRLALYPTFDYYFESGGSLWALNGDVGGMCSGSSRLKPVMVFGIVAKRPWASRATPSACCRPFICGFSWRNCLRCSGVRLPFGIPFSWVNVLLASSHCFCAASNSACDAWRSAE